eukprot:g37251.t1
MRKRVKIAKENGTFDSHLAKNNFILSFLEWMQNPKIKSQEDVLDVDKTRGPDEVYSRTLWDGREMIAGPLAEIFVLLTATDEVPEDWRLANVVPLFKKG